MMKLHLETFMRKFNLKQNDNIIRLGIKCQYFVETKTLTFQIESIQLHSSLDLCLKYINCLTDKQHFVHTNRVFNRLQVTRLIFPISSCFSDIGVNTRTNP